MKDISLDFPQLNRKLVSGRYTYLDSGATTLKPQVVIDRLNSFYMNEVSNVHRGSHKVGSESTSSYEQSRKTIADFIGANNPNEIIFTRSTTESLNLASHIIESLGLASGDEIVLTEMEHHSNILPWQMLAQKLKLKINYIPFDENGDLIKSEIEKIITEKTKVVAVTHVSNTLGTVNDISYISSLAKAVNAYVVVDAAQSVSAMPVKINDLGCDFLAFSGHKLFAPFGIGILWGKEDLLNSGAPYQGGGSMIDKVEKDISTYLPSPQRYEAGTPNVGGAVALAEAVTYLNSIGMENIYKNEKELLSYATDHLKQINNVKIVGESKTKVNVLSFNIEGIHHSDLSQLLDQQGVATRAGHHCTQLIFKKLNISGSIRITLSIYNTKDDIDYFMKSLKKSLELLI